uniref:Uncharacterized protein n=1 Tax=Nelumbo nucifera TaxID=4432 RepID=A0A822ZH43_NELNU|nr:TPA_asm: hypothetical protein HUJ06_002447 [Nelumbo nucifera]
MSLQTGVPSEYTHMILLQTDKVKQTPEPIKTREVCSSKVPQEYIYFTRKLCHR